jgi:restriction system protein
MAIPDYQSIMLPLLEFASDREEHSAQETVEALANRLALTDGERKELLPSGRQAKFDNRVGWARTYLKKAGLLKSTRRGYWQMTERGLEVLRQNPPEITASFLRQFPEFVEFQRPRKKEDEKATEHDTSEPQTCQCRDRIPQIRCSDAQGWVRTETMHRHCESRRRFDSLEDTESLQEHLGKTATKIA